MKRRAEGNCRATFFVFVASPFVKLEATKRGEIESRSVAIMKRILLRTALLTLTFQLGAAAQIANAQNVNAQNAKQKIEYSKRTTSSLSATFYAETPSAEISFGETGNFGATSANATSAKAMSTNSEVANVSASSATDSNAQLSASVAESSDVKSASVELARTKVPNVELLISSSMRRNAQIEYSKIEYSKSGDAAVSLGVSRPQEFTLPSPIPRGDATNDTIYFTWYRAQNSSGEAAPAVVLLHPLGSEDQAPMHQYARFLAARGISSAVVMLPFHGRRLARGQSSAARFISLQGDDAFRGLEQSVADVRAVVDWMVRRPEVDARRIGGIGISLGAIVLHVVMGQDSRVRAGVAIIGGGDLAQGFERSPLRNFAFLTRFFGVKDLTARAADEQKARLNSIDPLRFADENRPRRVLMIEAARDLVIPPRNAETLWNALGRPPIQWVDTNHFAPISLGTRSIERAAAIYLNAVWDDKTDTTKIPRVRVPLLKLGFISGLDSKITPAIQWQFLGIGTREHRSILGANLGVSGRGPFIGAALTLNSFVDIGAARRLNGDLIRPYVSFHVAY